MCRIFCSFTWKFGVKLFVPYLKRRCQTHHPSIAADFSKPDSAQMGLWDPSQLPPPTYPYSFYTGSIGYCKVLIGWAEFLFPIGRGMNCADIVCEWVYWCINCSFEELVHWVAPQIFFLLFSFLSRSQHTDWPNHRFIWNICSPQ
jgi:hypothetical protein